MKAHYYFITENHGGTRSGNALVAAMARHDEFMRQSEARLQVTAKALQTTRQLERGSKQLLAMRLVSPPPLPPLLRTDRMRT
jgi:hypothetical protein